MSIEFDAVYGYEVEETDEIERFAYEIGVGSDLSVIYSGDPIPGFNGYAIGVPLHLGSDTEKQLLDKIQHAKTILNQNVQELFKKKFALDEEPRIIIMASASW